MDAELITKVCYKCKIKKSITEFFKNKSKKDNLGNCCKSCSSENQKKYITENKEKIAKLKKKYRAKNKEKVDEYDKKYRAENKQKIAERYKKKYAENKEKIAKLHKKYRDENKEKISERNSVHVAELRYGYIKGKIVRSNPILKNAPIPQSLINLKREEIRIKRLIKEMTQ